MKIDFLNIFKRKSSGRNEEIELPNRIVITFTEEAKQKGATDDLNKIIKRYRNGIVVEVKPYSIHLSKAMSVTHQIGILDLTKSREEDYEFPEITALHGTIRRIVR